MKYLMLGVLALPSASLPNLGKIAVVAAGLQDASSMHADEGRMLMTVDTDGKVSSVIDTQVKCGFTGASLDEALTTGKVGKGGGRAVTDTEIEPCCTKYFADVQGDQMYRLNMLRDTDLYNYFGETISTCCSRTFWFNAHSGIDSTKGECCSMDFYTPTPDKTCCKNLQEAYLNKMRAHVQKHG